ncbi:3-phenylpropionate/trans-cinnamate dioxygenase ferredoxin reductase subunit [Brevibacterium iodinum ATCC 49514]|uniref:3-phenylpropionate/trans-cinnamate dioxygenase ferredoxin reductase subunit n=1 Tax=Brevibacterium iodinum ATCC 49514 TaxID=1255616 RepID=A0A2H1JHS5_9MICO|nr:FAD-dependent oxidoreductase [Brevibacterium iodinum]SMX86951.1 3-phenylpropionate/trans-cinnamate dioxygenase ferredoxin reductase subunit [Brevibacterium iodinum ATCC 49514]SUW14431.1 Rhodocoxin reductase [Brevibacterium iodinum]
MSKRIVIIGAGLAGTTAARELNARGRAVTVIDPQAGETCERPPLSKHLFDGSRHHLPYHFESTDHITFVRDRAEEITLAEAAAESRYTAETQRHPHRLANDHAAAGTIHLASGESIDFTHCILATGMEANRPEVPAYPDALPVYDLGDAEWILERVNNATGALNVGVLGSGYLGMEVAASAVAAGHHATVYLRGGEPLRKQLSAPVRQALFDKHKAAGVEFVTHTASPDDIPADVHDLFITSVGARPRLIPIDGHRPAQAWGVDESLATSHTGVFAAGDCAIVTAGPYALDRPWACEPVAESHGKFLAELLGEALETASNGGSTAPETSSDVDPDDGPKAWSDVPWHWSFQGPEKVFTAGLTSPDADDTIIRHDPSGAKFQVFHFDGPDPESELAGVETFNWPPMQAAARRVLGGNKIPTRAQIADPDFDFKAHSRL